MKPGAAIIGTIGTIGILAVVLCSAWVAAQAGPGGSAAPNRGRALYEQHCLRCHGKALDGIGPESPSLIVPPANLQSVQSRSKMDDELMAVISHGVVFSPMHGWRDRLTEDQMRDVLSYIRLRAPFIPLT